MENKTREKYANIFNCKLNFFIKNKKIFLLILSLTGVFISSYVGCNIGNKILIEQQRIAEINTEHLNLQNIVDFTDDAGMSIYQLNWKEILAIISVQKNNYTNNITKEDIISVSNLFIDESNNTVKSFEEVVNTLDLKNKEKERIYNYLDDLEYYGFTPERLSPDGEQVKFIESVKESAIENYKISKILPSITIAQAILESNWGNSNLTKEANNLFGIKADYYWKGDFVTFDTNEYHNYMIKDKFRKYNSLGESIKDHSDFLLNNNRYKENGVFEAKTYKEQALALETAGYSTAQDEFGNKTYAKMICELIRQYNLQIIDSMVVNNN